MEVVQIVRPTRPETNTVKLLLVAAACADWRQELNDVRTKFPMQYPNRDDVIAPQHAVEVRVMESVIDVQGRKVTE